MPPAHIQNSRTDAGLAGIGIIPHVFNPGPLQLALVHIRVSIVTGRYMESFKSDHTKTTVVTPISTHRSHERTAMAVSRILGLHEHGQQGMYFIAQCATKLIGPVSLMTNLCCTRRDRNHILRDISSNTTPFAPTIRINHGELREQSAWTRFAGDIVTQVMATMRLPYFLPGQLRAPQS